MKKKLLAVLSLMIPIMPIACSDDGEEVSWEMAWSIVKECVIGKDIDNVEVWTSYTPLPANTNVTMLIDDDKETSPGHTSWLFFVNDYPTANYSHPCRYVYVYTNNAKYVVHKQGWPPAVSMNVELLIKPEL